MMFVQDFKYFISDRLAVLRELNCMLIENPFAKLALKSLTICITSFIWA